MELDGKVAIVTGGSRGLGAATAKAFARAGTKVTLAARTEQPHPRIGGTLLQTADAIKAEGGVALPVRCNIASDEDVEAMVQKTVEEFGRIDFLVHPAAANFPGGVEANDMRRWDILMGINFRGVAVLAKAVLPSMKEAGGGHIINVSPRYPAPTQGEFAGPYGLSKTASTLLSMALAKEFGQYGIAVNTIWPEGRLRTEGMLAMGRVDPDARDPQKFADAVLAMMSQDPKTYTGRMMTDVEALAEIGVTDLSKYDLPPME